MKLYYLLIQHRQEANSTPLVRQPRKLGSRLSFSPVGYREGYYSLVERSCLEFLAGVTIEFRYVGCVYESA